MKRENLTVWEMYIDTEEKELVDLDEVNNLLDELYNKVYNALSLLEGVKEVNITNCKKELCEAFEMLQ